MRLMSRILASPLRVGLKTLGRAILATNCVPDNGCLVLTLPSIWGQVLLCRAIALLLFAGNLVGMPCLHFLFRVLSMKCNLSDSLGSPGFSWRRRYGTACSIGYAA